MSIQIHPKSIYKSYISSSKNAPISLDILFLSNKLIHICTNFIWELTSKALKLDFLSPQPSYLWFCWAPVGFSVCLVLPNIIELFAFATRKFTYLLFTWTVFVRTEWVLSRLTTIKHIYFGTVFFPLCCFSHANHTKRIWKNKVLCWIK